MRKPRRQHAQARGRGGIGGAGERPGEQPGGDRDDEPEPRESGEHTALGDAIAARDLLVMMIGAVGHP